MLGIHRNRAHSLKDTFRYAIGNLVEIVTGAFFTYRSVSYKWKFYKVRLNCWTRRKRWINAWKCLAAELVVLLSLGYLDADWA